MAKLYPPYIEGAIPAFVSQLDDQGNKITKLRVETSLNPTVSSSSFKGVSLLLKALNDNTVIANIEKEIASNDSKELFEFDLTDSQYKLIIGSYYKVQVAYVDNIETGYYSTVGITKYTTQPLVTINLSGTLFTATVSQTRYSIYNDLTEKLYSSRFELWKSEEKIADSGEIIHNTNNDVYDYEQIETYDFGIALQGKLTLKYIYTTKNGFSSEETLDISFAEETTNKLTATLTLNSDSELGSNILTINSTDESSNEDRYNILRGLTANGPWEVVASQKLINDIWTDYTISYGVEYFYILERQGRWGEAVGAINYFEDLFLYDGKRQLNIKFNPQVNTFKNTILETKVDTIGGQYPFIYRNGAVKYKELNIGGLISFNMEDQAWTLSQNVDKETSRISTPSDQIKEDVYGFSTNLTNKNIKRELDFKLEVMDWLNNGEPKLLRSPVEGTYLVRLINVSLTPEKTLGRALHSFTATAYEIGGSDIKSLKKFGFYGG